MNPAFWSLLHVPSGVEQSFADWGIDQSCQRTLQSAATDSFSFSMDLGIDAELPFEVTDTCVIKRNGVRYFYGRVTKTSISGTASDESVNYVLEGPWWWLDHRVYQQEWIISTNFALPAILATELRPRIILFQNLIITRAANPAFVASVVSEPMSVGTQIRKLLEYAIDLGAPMQIGTIDPADVFPTFSEVRDATCGELIRACLRWIPDCVVWFDYSTSVPTINIRPRSVIPSVSVPMLGEPTGGLTITPRHDLKVAGVRLRYEQTNNINETSWTYTSVDQAGSPDELQGVIVSVQLSGLSATVQYQTLQISTIDITASAFWKSVLPWLNQATGISISDVRLNNALVAGQTADASDATSGYATMGVRDFSNEVLSFAGEPLALQNLLTSGQVPNWLQDDFSDATVTAKISYMLADPDTGASVVKVKTPQTAKIKITTLDPTSGPEQFQNVTTATPAEAVPTGVAAAYYASSGILHYEGDYSRTEEEVSGDIGPGSKLNISGGPAAWSSMDALVQSVSEQLGSGQTTIRFGPPSHLSTADFIELQRINRARNTSSRIQERQDGRTQGSGAVIGAGQVPQATSVQSAVPGKELTISSKTDGQPAILTAYFKGSNNKVRRVVIDTAALIALADANSNIPDPFTIFLREWDVCDSGVLKKAVFLSSDPYAT